jgi:hypothetical protein
MDNFKLNLEWIPAAYATSKNEPGKNEVNATLSSIAPIVKVTALYQFNKGFNKIKRAGAN